MNEKKLQKLTAIITGLMSRYKVPGLSITITEKGVTTLNQGFGARNLERNEPATPQTLFNIGSVTKSFTAMAMMQLVERGAISLDDPVSSFLDIPLFSGHPDITIEHILSHSSGIPSLDGSVFPLAIRFGSYRNVIPLTSKGDFLRYLSGAVEESIFSPGKKFFYNNDMYTCAGFIIEDITGKAVQDYIREEILEPLGMERAVCTRERFEADPLNNRLTGYLTSEKDGKALLAVGELPFYEHLCAPGGLYCSTEELSRYARCLTGRGELDGKRILSPEGIGELWSPRIATPYGEGADPSYCLGWVREDDFYGTTLMHHAGSIGVSSAFLAVLPESGVTIAVAENDGLTIASAVGRSAAALVLGAEPAGAVKALRRNEIIELIQGSYYTYAETYSMHITFEEGVLFAEIETDDGASKFPIIPEGGNELSFQTGHYIPAKREGITFLTDGNGRIRHATFDRYLFHRK